MFAITLLNTSRPSRNLAPAKKSPANDMAMLLIKPVVVCSPLPFIVCKLNTSGTWAPFLGDDNRIVVIALGVSGALRFLWCWSLEFHEIQPGFILGCVCLKCLCWEPLLPYWAFVEGSSWLSKDEGQLGWVPELAPSGSFSLRSLVLQASAPRPAVPRRRS
jgi:hypothetical protein